MHFELKEQAIGDFIYFLKVTATGGEEYWSNQKLFVSQCGATSAEIQVTDINEIFEYPLDGQIPVLEINKFDVHP